ncbi:PREDICTED: C2 and GRAM domain-containing protein At5g50170-like [Camelina sativa]|uniref:C2 and GRAM domain-containing protein At5g50170-like n=1 Tax=Camelina sativa TaxID=90675 RepID=A0ABM0UKK2_CAMSA|nr:PREDICTED: C2 and GRAM domain-containing protein At5g50170-like [Camelina sativa]
MRLYVYILQAKDLPAKETFAKLHVGKHRSKTRVARDTSSPIWNEEFVFRITTDVVDESDDVVVSILHHEQEDRYHSNVSTGLIGKVRIPIRSVAAEENQTLLPTWFVIEKPSDGKFVNIECGKILLSLSLQGKWDITAGEKVQNDINLEGVKELEGSPKDLSCSKDGKRRKHHDGKHIMKNLVNQIDKLFHKKEEMSKRLHDDSSGGQSVTSNYEDATDKSSCSATSTCTSFEEGLDLMQSSDSEREEMPENLTGGVLVDQKYLVSPCDLNKFLFTPSSQFRKELAELQGLSDVQEGPWTMMQEDTPRLTRVVTYMRAATKMVKAVKATENQVYRKASGKQFAVFVSVSTPDVPYGNTFKIELLYKILSETEPTAGGEPSRLIISWGIQFSQSTIMKGMIEGGARQGLRESFEQFSDLLAKTYKTLDPAVVLDKEQVIATVQSEKKTDLKSAFLYFWSSSVICAVLLSVYVVVHILHSEPSKIQGFEFYGLDLPDSFGEVLSSGMLVLLLERVYMMTVHFIQARLHRGKDHGVKANGKGWILTIALIKGTNLASVEATEIFDPYVVFTCNGKTRTSSVKLQAQDPQWNEVIEFDAMEEPPSVLDVEVFDFDGPFDQGASLGHAEINFLKHTADELADFSVPLVGHHAQASQSKLQLRIFLENKNGVETMKDYLSKVEKEVGKKLNIRSPQKNSAFQKLFGLPHEEFLLKEYTCYLKRKLPVQGKLYLSARIVAFYSNVFGHKTKFYFLWEDIDDIQVLPPTFASLGSPLLLIILKKNRGLDAKHGAKSQDDEGRVWFYFQSFVSFDATSRTIMALWKTRTLSVYHRAQIAEEEQDLSDPFLLPEDVAVVSDSDALKMSKVYTCDLPCDVELVMRIFGGGELERKVMEKSGCLSYASTTWESKNPGVYERRLSYKYNHYVSVFGGGVTCAQQKSPAPNDDGWILNEIVALHDVPFGDHFRVHLRYEVKKAGVDCKTSKCEVYLKIRWLKTIKFEQRISKSIMEKFRNRLNVIFDLFQKESVANSSLTLL